MLRFAANLTLLFTELPFAERFAAARAAGFRAVECQFPYDEVTPEALAQLLRDNALELVLFNLPAGDWAAGDRGIACDPARVGEFRDGVAQALVYAAATGCQWLNCLAGLLPKGVTQAEAEAVLADNLAFAAAQLARHGLTLLVEPINTFDVPGFLLDTSVAAHALIKRVGAPNLMLQYDLYHMWRMGDDIAARLDELAGVIGHIQFADHPGRHEPGTGELPFVALFAQISAASYDGWVSAEYHPATTTPASLGWLNATRRTTA
jgi:hydroxypyruvate isomerase